jgi:uncharacterized membrane protein YhdT
MTTPTDINEIQVVVVRFKQRREIPSNSWVVGKSVVFYLLTALRYQSTQQENKGHFGLNSGWEAKMKCFFIAILKIVTITCCLGLILSQAATDDNTGKHVVGYHNAFPFSGISRSNIRTYDYYKR